MGSSRPASPRLATRLNREASIAVAMAVMNLSTFGFTAVIAARALRPSDYGAFMSAMNLLMIVSVASLGLQATAARRVSTDPEHVGRIEADVLRVTYRLALGLTGLLLVAAPLINRLLDLDSLQTALLVALAGFPLTVMGGQAGILQGERRWASLALLYLMAGVPRVFLGAGLLLWRPTETVAIFSVLVATWLPVFVGAWALGRHERSAPDPEYTSAALLRETLHNSQAIGAFLTLSSVDLILARNVLDSHDTGLYSAGLIVTKAVLFLPQFVVIVAFPAMSRADQRRRTLVRALAMIGVLGGLCVLGTALLPDLAIIFAGGVQYTEIKGSFWIFAILGTVLSMAQLIVYSAVARRSRFSTYGTWVAVAALIGVGLSTTSIEGLLATVVVVDVVLVLALLAATAYAMRHDHLEADPAQEPASARS